MKEMTLQEWACLYSAKGYIVIPLKPNKKFPLFKTGEYKEVQYKTPGEIKKIWDQHPNANIGIIGCRSKTNDQDGLFCIDLDKHEQNENGVESFDRWIQENGKVTCNWISKTNRNGYHYYFTGSVETKIGVLPGVDIVGQNHYIVMPPSIVEGKPHKWSNLEDVTTSQSKPFKPCESIQRLLELKQQKTTSTTIEEWQPINEGSRVNTLVSLCGKLLNTGMDLNTIKQTIEYTNSNQCKPPLTEKELKNEVLGCLNRFDRKPPKTNKNETTLHKPLNGLDLENMETKPLEFIVEGIIPSVGLGCISAPPKSFKSYMALDLALSIAEGKPFLGYETKKKNVLYLDLESSPGRLKQRINQIGAFSKNSYFYTSLDNIPTLGNGFKEMLEKQIKNLDIGLLIIDVFAKIRGVSTSKNEYQNDYTKMTELQNIALENNVNVLFVHHNRKMKSNDPYEQLNGSTGLFGSLDYCIVIKKKRNEKDGIFNIIGRDIEEQELHCVFDTQSMKWINRGNAEEYYKKIEKDQFLKDPKTKSILELMNKHQTIVANAQTIIDLSKENELPFVGDSVSLGQYLKANKDLLQNELNVIATPGRNHEGRFWKLERTTA